MLYILALHACFEICLLCAVSFFTIEPLTFSIGHLIVSQVFLHFDCHVLFQSFIVHDPLSAQGVYKDYPLKVLLLTAKCNDKMTTSRSLELPHEKTTVIASSDPILNAPLFTASNRSSRQLPLRFELLMRRDFVGKMLVCNSSDGHETTKEIASVKSEAYLKLNATVFAG